ncbi:LuxR family transcriptional regulator [Eggerthella sinensis]|uniref:LuxR family transcriptional regulator n=1 Tax=Eggerthella sinensis TaxID=242230 RepID=UPI00248E5D37|nr:LuxR family transcriptional regulator [Eggerthella sinensis]
MASENLKGMLASVRNVFACDKPSNLVLLTAGYALLTGWFTHLYGGIGPSPDMDCTAGYLVFYGTMYALIGVLSSAVMFACAAGHRMIDTLLDMRATRFVAPLLMATATVVLMIVPETGGWRFWGYLGLCAVGSAGWTILMLDFNRQLSHYPLQSIGAMAGIALLANLFASLVIVPTSPTANIVVTALCPIVAAAAIAAVKPDEAKLPARPADNPEHQKKARKSLYTMALCVMIWQMANKLVQTISAYPNSELVPRGLLSSLQPWTVAFILCFMVPVALYYLVRPKHFKFSHAYRVFFLLALVGVMGLELTTYPEAAPLLYSLNGAAFQSVNLVFWPIALYASHRFGQPLRILAISNGLWTLGPALGIGIGTVLGAAGWATSQSTVLLTIVSVMVVVISYLYLFSESDADFLADSLPPRRRMFRERCMNVADRFDLTPREREVMQLIATGKDMPAMQEILVLSKSTVSTHREHLYQKMDIHSKQELIALIDAEP